MTPTALVESRYPEKNKNQMATMTMPSSVEIVKPMNSSMVASGGSLVSFHSKRSQTMIRISKTSGSEKTISGTRKRRSSDGDLAGAVVSAVSLMAGSVVEHGCVGAS